jgi:hypothetical protein
MKTTGAGRKDVSLKTPMTRLFSGPQRAENWSEFRVHAGLPALPDLGFGRGWLFGPISVNDLVWSAVSAMASHLKEERSWTDEEVRQIVRGLISDQLGGGTFKDTDQFVRDLGFD